MPCEVEQEADRLRATVEQLAQAMEPFQTKSEPVEPRPTFAHRCRIPQQDAEKRPPAAFIQTLRGSPYGASTIRLFVCGLAGRTFAHPAGDSQSEAARQ